MAAAITWLSKEYDDSALFVEWCYKPFKVDEARYVLYIPNDHKGDRTWQKNLEAHIEQHGLGTPDGIAEAETGAGYWKRKFDKVRYVIVERPPVKLTA